MDEGDEGRLFERIGVVYLWQFVEELMQRADALQNRVRDLEDAVPTDVRDRAYDIANKRGQARAAEATPTFSVRRRRQADSCRQFKELFDDS